MNQRQILVGLNYILGPQRSSVLLRSMSPEEAWHGDYAFLKGRVTWKAETINKFLQLRREFDWATVEQELIKEQVEFVCFGDNHYPQLLGTIYDPPWVLYYKGNLGLLEQPTVAVVGSRKPTVYGRSVCYHLSQSLAGLGVVVVSGLARGIDAEAHKGALETGSTVAILGCGLAQAYPRENAGLQAKIAQYGLVISEFSLHTRPQNWHFPLRNRVISGLSLGTVVVEAEVSSGSLITADQALEQGREVFAVPGPVTSPLSAGCHNLIKQGARLVTVVDDIVEELGLDNLNQQPTGTGSSMQINSEERKVLEVIAAYGAPDIEKIVQQAGIPVHQVSVLLTKLEVAGIVMAGNGQVYTLKQPSWKFTR